jgi:hypothetical protein
MSICDIEDARSITELTPELESFILNSHRSQDVAMLMSAAVENDAVDIYRYIVEHYGVKQYGKPVFSFASFKQQHEAHLRTMKYISNGGSPNITEYIENGLKQLTQ